VAGETYAGQHVGLEHAQPVLVGIAKASLISKRAQSRQVDLHAINSRDDDPGFKMGSVHRSVTKLRAPTGFFEERGCFTFHPDD
jgi:hypothetical protein